MKTTNLHDVRVDGKRYVLPQHVFEYEGRHQIDVIVPDGASNKPVRVGIDIDQIKFMFLWSDQPLTIGDGTGSINLLTNKPYIWHESIYFTNLILVTADVDELLATNSSGVDARLRGEIIYDTTP